MKKKFLLSAFVLVASNARSQVNDLFVMKKDRSGFELTVKGASHLASLPLKCMGQEFPNKTSHTSSSDSDHVLLPRQLHLRFQPIIQFRFSAHFFCNSSRTCFVNVICGGPYLLINRRRGFPCRNQSNSLTPIQQACCVNSRFVNFLGAILDRQMLLIRGEGHKRKSSPSNALRHQNPPSNKAIFFSAH